MIWELTSATRLGQEIMSSYDKIFKVLNEWYTPDQIDEIWAILKDYDKKLQAASFKLDSESRMI